MLETYLLNLLNLQGIDIGGDIIPNIIDEIPILSIAASFAEGKLLLRMQKSLRVKESDRLAAIACWFPNT